MSKTKIYDGWIGGRTIKGTTDYINCVDAIRQNVLDEKLSKLKHVRLTHPIFGELIEYEELHYKGGPTHVYRYIKNQVFNIKLKINGTFNGRSTGGITLSSDYMRCYCYLTDFMTLIPLMSVENKESFVEGNFNFAVKGSAVGLVVSK